ncbi:hypothetical protein GBAR_LOCUS1144 [Geodia barretti]|uniref:Uncharacterized protein n=1 Tax=Geodia barretti TaxID=519541 RepID=A0AA35QUQ2_GEOBA|nr:hypothetical protein GBAR_LOCUS1144 [Geodia barretti]
MSLARLFVWGLLRNSLVIQWLLFLDSSLTTTIGTLQRSSLLCLSTQPPNSLRSFQMLLYLLTIRTTQLLLSAPLVVPQSSSHPLPPSPPLLPSPLPVLAVNRQLRPQPLMLLDWPLSLQQRCLSQGWCAVCAIGEEPL